MLNRKLVEYTDISSKYVKVGVRYCVFLLFLLSVFWLLYDLFLFLLLSVFMYALPGLSQVSQPSLPLQGWGVDLGELGTITQTYLSFFLNFTQKKTHLTFTTHTLNLFLSRMFFIETSLHYYNIMFLYFFLSINSLKPYLSE